LIEVLVLYKATFVAVEKCEHLALFSQAIHEQGTDDDLYNASCNMLVHTFGFSKGFASAPGPACHADAVSRLM
jgi:hypothetical protein